MYSLPQCLFGGAEEDGRCLSEEKLFEFVNGVLGNFILLIQGS